MSTKAYLDSETGKLWERHWDVIQKSGAGKKILLVEGDDDKSMMEQLLRFRSPDWARRVYVGVAGDRDRVFRALEKNSSWYGFIDRDIWDAADEERRTRLPDPNQLTITEGWYIENHFCVPDLLAKAVRVDEKTLRDKLEPFLAGWLRYGAIWWSLQQKRKQLLATMPDSRCGHPINDACPDAAALRTRLSAFAHGLASVDVDRIIEDVERREAAIKERSSERERIEQGIHGKLFFQQVIVDDVLKHLLKQSSASKWRTEIANALQQSWPLYLQDLADRLLY